CLAYDRGALAIDGAIVLRDAECRCNIETCERIQRVVDQIDHHRTHVSDRRAESFLRIAGHLYGDLCDALRLVTHTLEVDDRFDHAEDESQVAGGRLTTHEHLATLLIE